jgi:hypothetical protein
MESKATTGRQSSKQKPQEMRSAPRCEVPLLGHATAALRAALSASLCYTSKSHTHFFSRRSAIHPHMLLSKEYVGYLAREVTKKLIAAKAIETAAVPKVTERVHASLLEELTLEDRINDEVRVILEAYSEEMNKAGANYQEMFRKVKSELVRKYKAVL